MHSSIITKNKWNQRRLGVDFFNVNQYNSAKKTWKVQVYKLMFADDAALVAYWDVQKIIALFAQAAKSCGLKINIRKYGCISHNEGDLILLEDQ